MSVELRNKGRLLAQEGLARQTAQGKVVAGRVSRASPRTEGSSRKLSPMSVPSGGDRGLCCQQ